MKYLKYILIIALPALLLLGFLSLTNPYEVPLVVLLIPFGLLFWLVYQFIAVASRLNLLNKNSKQFDKDKNTNTTHRLFIAAVSFVFVLIAVLQSIQQLTIRDLLLVSVLMVLTLFYIRKLA